MSEPKAKPPDVFATVRAAAIRYVRLLSPATIERLAAWAGAAAPGKKDDAAELCVTAAATSEGTRKILAAIDRDAREMLMYLLCGMSVPREQVFDAEARDFFGWPKARARAAIEALFAAGLVMRERAPSYGIDVFPALRLGLGPDLLVWLAGATDDAAVPMPFARRLALLLAHMHADPAVFTGQDALTVRWSERVQDVFSAAGFPLRYLTACVGLLARFGAITPDPSDPAGKIWRVEAKWPEMFAAPASDLALSFIDMAEVSAYGATLGTMAMLERAKVAGEASPTITRLAELGKAWVGERRSSYVPYYDSHFRPLAVASAVRVLHSIGLVTIARVEGTPRVTRIAPSPRSARPFQCTVLPTFEIWVAEDADPVGTAELGRIAELVGTDRVAKFALTQRSVIRAAREPGGIAAAIERLAASAEHGLPDNVRSTLEGWAKRATLMRAYRGAFIATATEEQAAFVRGRSGVLGEIVTGVFHVDSEALADLLKAAEKAGHVLAPVVRDGRSGASRRSSYVETIDPRQRAGEALARIADWAKPESAAITRPTNSPYDRPSTEIVLGRGDDDGEPGTLQTLSLSDLRRDWPEVAAAVKGYAPLQWAALRLDEDELYDLVDLGDDKTIRLALTRLALEESDFANPGDDDDEPPPPVPEGELPWLTPSAGTLSEILIGAATRGAALEIIYVSASGQRSEKKVLPLQVLHSGGREWLVAKSVADGTTNRFDLDRIAAIRV